MTYASQRPCVVIARFADNSDVGVKSQSTVDDYSRRCVTDETGRLRSENDMVLMLDAAFNYGNDPASITLDLWAFSNKSLSANQCLSACVGHQ